ncbi:MAG: hypothetical protein ACHQIM_13200 [Sphingobacteriales bacterium]
MKKLPFILSFLLCVQLGIAQSVKNSLSEQHLKGRVKRIETGLFDGNPVDGKIDTLAPHTTFIDLFDEKGNETEDSYFGKDGLMISKWVKKYNGKNEETEEDHFTKDGSLESTIFFKYDERGNQVESNSNSIADKTSDKSLYKYDDKNNMVEADVFYRGDTLRYRNIYKYDDKGNKVEMDYWRAKEDTMRVKWTFSCNDAGDEAQRRRYTPNGVMDAENNFTYENFDWVGNWQKKNSAGNWHNRQGAKISSYSVTVRKIYYY